MAKADALDAICYGCGTLLALDLTEAQVPVAVCPYCESDVIGFTDAAKRRRLSQLRDEFWYARRDVDVPIPDEESVEGTENSDAGVGWAVDEDLQEPDHLFVDGIPVQFTLSYRYGKVLGAAMEAMPAPPALQSRDDRHQRWFHAIGERYATSLREEIEAVAPTIKVRTHPREPAETGGPGVEFDIVTLIVATLAAYPAAKELVRDVRAAQRRLAELSEDGDADINAGVALLYARDALFEEHGIDDSTLIAADPIHRPVDFWFETDGYIVTLAAQGRWYVVTLDRRGNPMGIEARSIPEFPDRRYPDG